MNKHHYVECGLDNIYLMNVSYADREDARSLEIADVDRLHHAIASAIVLQPRLLSGPEIFFLRTELGLKLNEYGGMLGLSIHRIFKWEEGIMPIGVQADLIVRLIYAASCSDGDLGRDVVSMRLNGSPTAASAAENLTFERTDRGWGLVK